MVEKRKSVKATAQKIGNPPKYPQFGKGTAGNPKGRPRGSKNLSTYLVKAASDQVSRRHVGGAERFRSYKRQR
jgi:hypothetical protein